MFHSAFLLGFGVIGWGLVLTGDGQPALSSTPRGIDVAYRSDGRKNGRRFHQRWPPTSAPMHVPIQSDIEPVLVGYYWIVVAQPILWLQVWK